MMKRPRVIGNHSQYFVRQIVHRAITLPSLDDTDKLLGLRTIAHPATTLP